MKKLILLIMTVLLTSIVFSQKMEDALYLKNGSMIKGEIIEQVPNERLKIKTKDGNIFVYQFSEIEKITQEKEEINLDEYGGKYSYGIAIGGGGIVGIPFRTYLSSKFALELGVFYRPGFVINADQYFHSVVLAGGPNIYLQKQYKAKKERIILNGITVKTGVGFGDFSTFFIGGGWIYENFKKTNKNRSFSMELGPAFINSTYPAGYTDYGGTSFALYWKFLWSWYKQ